MIGCHTPLCRMHPGALHTWEPVDQHGELGALEASGEYTELCRGRCNGDRSAKSQVQRDLGLPEK